jgi:hypothetical protein
LGLDIRIENGRLQRYDLATGGRLQRLAYRAEALARAEAEVDRPRAKLTRLNGADGRECRRLEALGHLRRCEQLAALAGAGRERLTVSMPAVLAPSIDWADTLRIVGAVWIAIVVVALVWFTTIALDLTVARAARAVAVALVAAVTTCVLGLVLGIVTKPLGTCKILPWVLVMLAGALCGLLFRRRSAVIGAFLGAVLFALIAAYVSATGTGISNIGMTDRGVTVFGRPFSASPTAFAAWLLGGSQPPLDGWEGWGRPEEVPTAPVILIALAAGAAGAMAALAAWWLARRWARWREGPTDYGA